MHNVPSKILHLIALKMNNFPPMLFHINLASQVSDDLLITVVQLDGESPLWRAEDDLMFLDVDDEESYHHEEVVDSKSDTNTSESPLNLEARTSHAIPNIQTDTNDTSANLRAGFGDEILPAEERICQLVPSDTTSTLSAGLITPSATTSACPGTDAATLRDRTLDMLGFTPNTSAPGKTCYAVVCLPMFPNYSLSFIICNCIF